MKKLLNIAAALLASTMIFVGCSNGTAAPAEPEYQTIDVDISDYSVKTLNWYPTASIPAADLLGLTSGGKVTISYELEGSPSYIQICVNFDNEYDADGNVVGDGWAAWTGKYYDLEGNVLKTSSGKMQDAKVTSIVLKPTDAEIAKMKKTGLIIQGDPTQGAPKLSGVKIEYVGEKFVAKNVTNFAKADGTVGGDAKVVTDPALGSVSVMALEEVIADVSRSATYDFAEVANLKVDKKAPVAMKITVRANGGLAAASFANGFYERPYVQLANRWGYSVAKTADAANGIPAGAIYNPWNVAGGPAKIVDFYPGYSDASAIAYSNYDGDYQSGGLSDGYVLDAPNGNKIQKTEGEWTKQPISISIVTDKTHVSTYVVDSSTTIPSDYTTFTIPVKAFERAGEVITYEKDGKTVKKTEYYGVKWTAVKGIQIDTNESAGNLYIRSFDWVY